MIICFLATEYHLGLLKAKLAKFRQALMEGDSKSGAGKVCEKKPSTCFIIHPSNSLG